MFKTQRFISMPNVYVLKENSYQFISYDWYLIDFKNVVHYKLESNIFYIKIKNPDYVDDYIEIKSDWSNNPILCLLMEIKLLRLMNYWHKDD
jgi:hypothetical protein